ncbi:MAG: hypothetical protein VXW38_18660 [Bacteroidota bacterium]|nr:hypothetical protein [Bacteroidota bacterium]
MKLGKKWLSMITLPLVLFCAFLCYAQEMPKVIPPTPEAAQLFKNSEIPVSPFTGRANIDIPIFDLKSDSGSIPVSLSYNASGIRVNEIASRVGLGWNLMAGGMISRQVRGIPDDNTDGYINTTNLVSDFLSLTPSEQSDLYQSVLAGYQDYESDIYSYSFLGMSGSFYFNQNGEVISNPKGDLIITPLQNAQNAIIGWELIVPDGTIYTFGIIPNSSSLATENKNTLVHTFGSQLPSQNPGLYNHTSSWYLTKITSINGNETIFTYFKNLNLTIEFWDVLGHDKEFAPFNSASCQNNNEILSFSQTEYNPIYLEKIENGFGRVEFEYQLARQDLINDYALTAVKLYNNQNSKLDQYEFNYGYFNSTDTNSYTAYGIPAQRNKRLYLNTLTQINGAIANKEYLLSYYTDDILPNRFSFSQDLWGYFNGQSNNDLYPETELNTGSQYITILGGDRKVYQNYVKACTLKSIMYPTKGKSEFIYESNDLTGEQGFYIGTQYTNKIIPGGNLGNITGINYAGVSFTSNFTLTTSFPYDGKVDYSITIDTPCNYANNDCPTIQIYQSDGITLVHTFQTDNVQGTLNLPNGYYVLKITNGPFQTDNNVNVSLSGRELIPNTNGSALTGGLRIKDILYKDYDNTLLKKVSYQYKKFNDNQISSGLSLNPPTFLFFNVPITGGGSGGINCSKNILSSSPKFPLNGQSSSHVGYTNVTEVINDGNDGKIEYTFLFTPDPQLSSDNTFELGVDDYPLVPSWDYSHRRGLMLKKAIYESGGGTPIIEYSWQYDGGMSTNEYDLSGSNIAMGKLGDYNGAVSYTNMSERYYKTSEEEKEYGGAAVLEQTKSFVYESGYSGRTFPLTVTTTDSKGNGVRSNTYYPDDISSTNSLPGGTLSSAAYSAVMAFKKNGFAPRVGIPIQTESINNGDTLITRTNYKNWGNGLYLPEVIQSKKLGGPMEEKYIISSYDTKGNITQMIKKDGPPISYIWGYNQQYPVAKIENATRAQMESALGVSSGYHTGSGGLSITQGNTLRNGLLNAMVTIYTYNPLIGLTSITDPKGNVIYYEYDAYNRLEFIKDANDNLVQEFKYNYKN